MKGKQPPPNELTVIASSPLFSGIATEELLALFSRITYSTKSYAKDTLIMMRGDKYNELTLLLSGGVSAEIQDFTGKVIKVENLQAPDALALGILFADDNTLPVTIVAQSDVKVIAISKQAIVQLAQFNQQFLQNYFTQSANKMAFMVEKLRLFKFSSLKQKLCGYLLSLQQKQQGQTVTLPYNREELAAIFGVARPSLSRVFSELVDLRLLAIQGKQVTIVDEEKLKGLLNQ